MFHLDLLTFVEHEYLSQVVDDVTAGEVLAVLHRVDRGVVPEINPASRDEEAFSIFHLTAASPGGR